MFSLRQWIQRSTMRQALTAAVLLGASTWASAEPGTRLATEASLDQVERTWVREPDLAVAMLQGMQFALQAHGSAAADALPTISDVYWRYARAVLERGVAGTAPLLPSCAASYRSLYQATALGFLSHWTHRVDAYHALASKLQHCLPEDTRDALGKEAWRLLRSSALRDLADIHALDDSGLNSVVAEPSRPVLDPIPPQQVLAKAAVEAVSAVQDASREPVAAQTAAPQLHASATILPAIEREAHIDVDALMRFASPIVGLLIVLYFGMSILSPTFKGAAEAPFSSKEPEGPAKPGDRAARSARTQPTRGKNLARARLVRMRPWD